jgi:hypothetical protein
VGRQLAALALLAAAGGAARATPDAAATAGETTVDLRGQIADDRGRPVSEVLVFAVERGSTRIVAATRPDPDGLFVMKLAPRVHDFGIMSSRWLMGGFDRSGPSTIKLVAYAAFPDADAHDIVRRARSWAKVAAPSRGDGAGIAIAEVTGVVRDETGVPLQGVRLISMDDRNERLVAVSQTDRQGRYTLMTLAGPARIYIYAPGLALKEGKHVAIGQVDLTLTVDTEVETITLRTGRRLAFNVKGSIYPEMLPPRQVAAVLSLDYGIALAEGCFCPGDLVNSPPPTVKESLDACGWSQRQASCHDPKRCPASTWARACMLPQYWWLRLIQMVPPNPTRLRSAEDTPTLWWYDAIKAMQEDDARVAAKGPARRAAP